MLHSETSIPVDLPQDRILVVDDEPSLRDMIKSSLADGNLVITIVGSVEEAKEKLLKQTFDLIITDIVLPGENGIELLKYCQDENFEIPVIVMSGYADMDRVVDALNLGAYSFLRKPFQLQNLHKSVNSALAKCRLEKTQQEFHKYLSLTNADLRQKVIDSIVQQEVLFMGCLSALAETIDARDPYTQEHSAGVAAITKPLAAELGLDFEGQQAVKTAGALHDIGKIAVSEAILLKPGKLTVAEFEIMKQHPIRSAAILRPVPGLEKSIPCIRAHHERWDGGGYPDGIKGDEIPFLACILSICDTWDAMTSDRPYRKSLSLEKAVSIIKKEYNRQFCGRVVDAFVSLVEKGRIKHSKEEASKWK